MVTTPLYKKKNIVFSKSWKEDKNLNINSGEHQSLITSDHDLKILNAIINDEDDSLFEIDQALIDEFFPDDDINPGAEETLFDNTFENIIMASGEGHTPILVLCDQNAEVLSFPSIFGGEERISEKPLTYNEIVRSQIRNKDRRACKITYLLYMLRKYYELLRINNMISTTSYSWQ